MFQNLPIKTTQKISKVSFLFFCLTLISCDSSSSEPEKNETKPAFKLPSSIGIVGDTSNVNVITSYGTVLMGGSTDVDTAMKWMINKSKGGDVVVLRASGSTGYNQYLYDLVKIGDARQVNSVETLLINNKDLANNPKIAERIKQAEMLFIAGGDQSNYINFWQNTLVEDAINYLINTKKIPVGGTSAGCAILGEAFYTAQKGSVTSSQALADPYNVDMTIDKGEFLNNPFLTNTITDTHYNNPDRKGRHIAFLARLIKDFNVAIPQGIGIEEQTAVCIDENGKAIVFGYGSAYFLRAESGEPENCIAGSPLNWVRNKNAIKTYIITGNDTGNGSFDLNNWTTVSGGNYKYFYSVNGILTIE